ncbi:MAG TPA: DUF4105 domain-containing protein [Ancylobacter sp.]
MPVSDAVPPLSAGKRSRFGLNGAFLLAAVLLLAAWTCAAFWFQLGPVLRWVAIAAVVALAATIVRLGQRRKLFGWLALAVALVAAVLWWMSIEPSDNRDWAPDVARGITARIQGSEVIVSNVRNFEWRTETDFTPRWETRRYEPDAITSVDLFTSVWGNPAIAHTLISFGFSDGQHLVFSAEIRRERGEEFSEIGGFFKQFELVMIAATESDIVRLRTNMRREDVHLYPLRMSPERARELFVSFLQMGNDLARQPKFYQTVTSNCTTVIFKLARLVNPGIPLDWRILVSGYLPEYLYDHGLIANDRPFEEIKAGAAISPRALKQPDAADFSAMIRRN